MTLLRDSSPDLRDAGPLIIEGIYRLRTLEKHPTLLHGISIRSAPDGIDWNLSARRGTPENPPSLDTALANRKKLADALGMPLDRVVGCQQVHGTEVAIVGAQDGGRGMYPDVPSIQGADALVTGTPGLYLMALSADCPSVFFYDPVRQAVGLAHSGWKGTVGRISANVVEAMVDDFGCEPADLVVAIGPGIGPCCYSIGPNVVEAVESAFPHAWGPTSGQASGDRGQEVVDSQPAYRESRPVLEEREGLAYFDLWEGIRRALLEAGVLPENLSVERVCTGHNLDVFYSHRLEKGQCGLFGAVLGIRGTWNVERGT